MKLEMLRDREIDFFDGVLKKLMERLNYCIKAVVENDKKPSTIKKLIEYQDDYHKTPIVHLPISDWATTALIMLGEIKDYEMDVEIEILINLYNGYKEMYKEDADPLVSNKK